MMSVPFNFHPTKKGVLLKAILVTSVYAIIVTQLLIYVNKFTYLLYFIVQFVSQFHLTLILLSSMEISGTSYFPQIFNLIIKNLSCLS